MNVNSDIGKLDRHTDKRDDQKWIKKKLSNKDSVFIPVYDSKFLFNLSDKITPVFLTNKSIKEIKIKHEKYIFLGESNNKSYFTIEVDDKAKVRLERVGKFCELRKSLPFLKEFEIYLLLYARAITYWQFRHKFCGTCGSPNINMQAGNLLMCSDKNCGQSHFPRTDPAVIVLVTKDDKCLLGHNNSWPSNRYSTLAGFVEPGETLEDTVIREIFEESGIIVKNIKYFASQPWPFPSSLMIGFTAEAENEKIQIDNNELENAEWFTREEIKKRLIDKTIKMPTKISIAFKLVSAWFDKGGIGKLSDISNND